MKRSKFSLSNYKLLSADMGTLTPIGITEVLPGDTIQQSTSALVRVSPLLSPVMHPVEVRIHHWYVPNRILWDDWEDFITGGSDGMDISEFPTITMPVSGGATVGSLSDYMGIPTGVPSLEVNALPFRAYAKIFNEWYRDQDLETELPISTESGADTTTNTLLQNCAWEKDYFTSARPWTQKGADVTIPFGTSAPTTITRTPNADAWIPYDSGTNTIRTSDSSMRTVSGLTSAEGVNISLDPNGGLTGVTDLTNASAINVNQLREAFAIQRYQEARARYGSRYTEYLRYLGVKSSDARLQRPEYLGGGKQTIQFSEVLQTGIDQPDTGNYVGNLRGHGIGAMRSNRFRRFIEEHGFVITLMSVKPKTIYSQGLQRHWNRRTKEDFFQKELQHIGQQEILNKEIYAGHTTPEGVFGYQDRYDEYRRTESTIAGEFRTNLDFWHYARIFASDPVLNGDFIKAVPTKRVNAVQDAHVLWVMANHSIQARRLVAGSAKSFIL
jgi:hypothetical protein